MEQDHTDESAGRTPAAAAPAYKVVDVRATGRTPETVGADLERVMNEAAEQGWRYRDIRPIIYNSSTTGYLLVILDRERD
ncbi:DUF4177 domain-containing protein [Streptomyces sp. SBT349]|uniref:DUF4177 domain-containing protein n=1 Tax=Streptomyces sp. SBT349 TaxID=1580539 RepID=UPI00066D2996|nr:DUF4177 domain-containing protein [Streptomyces sp. SBT349]